MIKSTTAREYSVIVSAAPYLWERGNGGPDSLQGTIHLPSTLLENLAGLWLELLNIILQVVPQRCHSWGQFTQGPPWVTGISRVTGGGRVGPASSHMIPLELRLYRLVWVVAIITVLRVAVVTLWCLLVVAELWWCFTVLLWLIPEGEKGITVNA